MTKKVNFRATIFKTTPKDGGFPSGIEAEAEANRTRMNIYAGRPNLSRGSPSSEPPTLFRNVFDASNTISEVKWKNRTRVGGIFFASLRTVKSFLGPNLSLFKLVVPHLWQLGGHIKASSQHKWRCSSYKDLIKDN